MEELLPHVIEKGLIGVHPQDDGDIKIYLQGVKRVSDDEVMRWMRWMR